MSPIQDNSLVNVKSPDTNSTFASWYKRQWAVVVAHLVEWLFPPREIRGCRLTINCIEKAKIKKKRPVMALLKKNFDIESYNSNKLPMMSYKLECFFHLD